MLLLICFGVIEFGRAYYTYNILTKAVRDGATLPVHRNGYINRNRDTTTTTKLKTSWFTATPRVPGTKKIPDLLTTQVTCTSGHGC